MRTQAPTNDLGGLATLYGPALLPWASLTPSCLGPYADRWHTYRYHVAPPVRLSARAHQRPVGGPSGMDAGTRDKHHLWQAEGLARVASQAGSRP
jgi:hypothetical protein